MIRNSSLVGWLEVIRCLLHSTFALTVTGVASEGVAQVPVQTDST